VLLLDTDWGSLVWNVTDRARHRRVLEAWEAHLAEPRLPRTLRTSLRAAGFVDVRVDVIPLLNAVRDPDTYSAGMIDMIARFVAGRDGLSRTDAQAWRDDVWEREDYFFSLNRYVFRGARPRGRSGVDGSSGARLTQPVDRLAADLGAAGHGEDGVLEARLEGQPDVRARGKLDVDIDIDIDADERRVHPAAGASAVDLAEQDRGAHAGALQDRQVRVVLEAGRGRAVLLRQRVPQLGAVQERGMRARGLLGVRDALPRRHQAELAGPDHDVAAEGVPVVHLAVEQPAHRLQADVRVRGDLHARLAGDLVRTVVVHEAPRADHPPVQARQQASDLRALPQQHGLRAQRVVRRTRRRVRRTDGDRRVGRHVAHRTPVRARRFAAP
jgi:hypothetical protein